MKTTLRVTGAALVAAGLIWITPAANAAPAQPKSAQPGIQSDLSTATDVSAQRHRYRRVYRAYPRYRYYPRYRAYPRYYGYSPYYAPYYSPYYRPYYRSYGPGLYFGAPGFRFGFGF